MEFQTARRTIAALLAGASAIAIAGTACGATDTATDAATAATQSDNTSSTIVVTAAPREEIKARAVEQNASNIVRVQAAETIAKYPAYNAAEALSRIPDISLSSDTGEGRFVQIRGVDANLNGATFAGVPLLNTNPGGTAAGGGGRAVEYDTIPTGAINGIVVFLTGQPDHEAEGLGGSIELTPRNAVNIDQPILEGSVGGGYEPLHKHGGPYEGELALSARFGIGDHGLFFGNGSDQAPRGGFISNPAPFSFVIYASAREDRRAIDDLEESYIDDPFSRENAIHQYDLRRYDYHRRRYGYGGEFDFEPNDNHRWYVIASVAGYVESVHKNFLLLRHLDKTEVTPASPGAPCGPPCGILVDPNNPHVFDTTGQPAITLTDEIESHRNQVYIVGGQDQFGDVRVDYRGAYSRATFVVARNIGARFSGPDGTPITYDNVTTPNFPIFTFPGGFNVNDPTQYTLDSVSNNQTFAADTEWSGAANLSFPLHLFGGDDQLKFGTEIRFRTKTVAVIDDVFGDMDGNIPAINLATVSFAPIRYYDNHYSNGPQVQLLGFRKLIANGTIPQQAPMAFAPSFIDDEENIYAGYVQYTGQWGPWGLLAGVRVEDTDAHYGAFITNADSGAVTGFDNRPVQYVNAFPTVQLRYNIMQNLVARLTYSTGIARPGFLQNTSGASVSNPVPGQAIITRGNPNLQPIYGDNFDFSVAYYLDNGGVINVGVFDKEFKNYIANRVQHNVPDPLAPGPLADNDSVTSFLNIPTGYARGFDADYHQKYVFLPKPFDGLGIDANVTLVDSQFLEYDAQTVFVNSNHFLNTAEHGLLPGTSPITWNVAGFYEAYGFNVRLAAQYVEHSLFGLGGLKQFDTIQDNRLSLDWHSAYQVDKNWSVYFDAKNLLNTPLRYYEGVPFRPIQREFYDATYEGGIRFRFGG